jgi:hypothetical protein
VSPVKVDGKAEADVAKPSTPTRNHETPSKAAPLPAAPGSDKKEAPAVKAPASPAPPASSARKGARYTLKALLDLRASASSLNSDKACMQELMKVLEEASELDPDKEMPARQAESGARGGGQRNAGPGGPGSGAGTPRKGGRGKQNDVPLRDRTGKIIEVKALEMSENRWKPSKPTDEEEKVFKAAKGILNKLTLEKFDKLYGELLNVGITSASLMRGLVVLIYDKAVLEPHFINMYAKMCQRLAKDLPEFSDENGVLPFGEVLIGK